MNSDYVDLGTEFVNLNAEKEWETGEKFRLQNSSGGRNVLYSDADVYIVISDSEPADREAALKSAIILGPGGESYEYAVRDGVNAWAVSPYGESSLSIQPLMVSV